MKSPLAEAVIFPKGRNLWNDNIEVDFKEIRYMVSAETFLDCPDCKILFILNIYSADKNLGAIITQNNKPIYFFFVILSKPHSNCTTTEN